MNQRWPRCLMNEGAHPRPALKRSSWEGGRSLKAVQFKRLACDAPYCRGPSTHQRVAVLPSARTAIGSAGQSTCDFGSAPRMSRSKTGSICKITSYLDYHCEIVPPRSDSRLADDRSSTEYGFDQPQPVVSRFEDRWSFRDSGFDKRCRRVDQIRQIEPLLQNENAAGAHHAGNLLHKILAVGRRYVMKDIDEQT